MLPKILTIGSYSLSGYLFFNIIAFIVALITILILSYKDNLNLKVIFHFYILGIIIAILGAKLYSIIFALFNSPGFYIKNLGMLLKRASTAGAFYGGFILAIIFCILYGKKIFKEKIWKVFDITVIGLAVGQAIGRIGCFSSGCCYGKTTTLPWGVKFPFLGSLIHPYSGTYIHPTQLYEAILNFINFIFLLILWRRKKFNGQVFSLYLINYGLIRFFIEYIRGDGGRGYLIRGDSVLTSLSVPQLMSIILFISGILILKKEKP